MKAPSDAQTESSVLAAYAALVEQGAAPGRVTRQKAEGIVARWQEALTPTPTAEPTSPTAQPTAATPGLTQREVRQTFAFGMAVGALVALLVIAVVLAIIVAARP